jgi:hypothetical protein
MLAADWQLVMGKAVVLAKIAVKKAAALLSASLRGQGM